MAAGYSRNPELRGETSEKIINWPALPRKLNLLEAYDDRVPTSKCNSALRLLVLYIAVYKWAGWIPE